MSSDPGLYVLHEGTIIPEEGDDLTLLFGSERVRQRIILDDDKYFAVSKATVADNYGAAILWTTGDGGFTTFSHGVLIADKDVFVEFRSDNASPEYALLLIKAGCPMYFGPSMGAGTTERVDGAVLTDNTDFDTIDRIEVQRNVADAAGDAKVTLFLFA